MKITETFPINPVAWAIHFFIKNVPEKGGFDAYPVLEYKEEILLKKPEQTLKDGYGNCINQSILRLNMYGRESPDCKSGIFYGKRVGGNYHAEFGIICKGTLSFGFLNGITQPLFITKQKIYRVEL